MCKLVLVLAPSLDVYTTPSGMTATTTLLAPTVTFNPRFTIGSHSQDN